MTGGETVEPISSEILHEDYFINLHGAYRNLSQTFRIAAADGMTQDKIAMLLDTDKGSVSRRMSGRKNHNFKTLSFLASALQCRLEVSFVPYDQIAGHNHYSPYVQSSQKPPAANEPFSKAISNGYNQNGAVPNARLLAYA